jgi:hypothetical protein
VCKHCFYLASRNAREPLKKLVYRGAILQILEKRVYGYARLLEDPGTTNAIRVTFYRSTTGPHGVHRTSLLLVRIVSIGFATAHKTKLP